MLFDWYQYVCAVCKFFARIQSDSDDIREMPALHYSVLIALLNRCSRLMLANIKLSDEGLFGETTAILDRCIFESVVKLRWLCHKGDDADFRRLVLDGLKSDLEFRNMIQSKIRDRGSETLVIEARMLASIDRYLDSVPTTEAEVNGSQKALDVASMIDAADLDRLVYVVGQKLGWHHVHGTWPSLYRDYLENLDGVLAPRDHDCPTHENQYLFVMTIVLDALRAFANFVANQGEACDALTTWLDGIEAQIDQLRVDVFGADFQKIELL